MMFYTSQVLLRISEPTTTWKSKTSTSLDFLPLRSRRSSAKIGRSRTYRWGVRKVELDYDNKKLEHVFHKQGGGAFFGGVASTRWWFQRFFIFTPTWGRFPIWLIFLKWVETTNQSRIDVHPFFWRTQMSTFDDFDAWQSHGAQQVWRNGEDIRGLSMCFFLSVVCILCVYNLSLYIYI